MKKYFVSVLALLVLVTMLAIPAMAAGGSVTVSNAAGASGEVVTVTVSLSGFEQATALGITYSGTPEMVNSASEWKLQGGALTDIGTEQKNSCVWAASDPANINGDVLKLALRLPAYDGTKSYSVSVTVKAMCNSTVLGEVTKTAAITVSNPAESVTLDKSTLALDLSGTKTGTLTATAAPATTTDTVVWSSSDASVASVANGTVTALKPGTATITATAGAKSATCAVTVTCGHGSAVKTEAKVPSCQVTGNNAYYTCGDCQQVLKADKATVTTVAAETLAKVAHSGGTATCTKEAVCTVCQQPYGQKTAHSFAAAWSSDANQHWHICSSCNTEKGSLANHSFTWKVDKAATEDVTGLKHEECACGYKRSENTVIPKLDHVHTGITKHGAVAATCVKTGTVEYWTCSSAKCAGKYYGDAQCQIGLSTITQAIDPANHAGKGAYQSDASQHWQVCDACNGVMGEKTAHSFQWVVDKAATEAATGLKHEACSVCKLERSKDTVVDKLPHIPTYVEGKDATCTEGGALEHFYCANCGGYYASEHGKQGTAINKEDITITALGHRFGTEWSSDGKGHWHVCATCEEASEAEAHTTELVGAVEATEEAEGYTGDTVCTVCEAVVSQGKTIPIGGEEPTVPETTPTEGEPAEPAEKQEQKMDTGVVIAICLLALIVLGGGAYVLIKKPWKK